MAVSRKAATPALAWQAVSRKAATHALAWQAVALAKCIGRYQHLCLYGC